MEKRHTSSGYRCDMSNNSHKFIPEANCLSYMWDHGMGSMV